MINRYGVSASAMIAALLSAGGSAIAAGTNQLEQVVVTAQRHSENLQKTPVAVAVVTAADLARLSIKTSADLGKDVPGLLIANTGINPSMWMRGVGGTDVDPSQSPSFAYSVDGVNYFQPPGATGAFYDVSQVEVLKGPQGTLFGRNTAAGAINVFTHDPVLGAYNGEIGLGYGNYNDISAHGVVNLPLTSVLAARFAVNMEKHDGYLSLGDSDLDSAAGRIKLLYQPDADFSVKTTASYFHNGGKGQGDVPINIKTGTYFNPSNPWEEFPATGVWPNLQTTVPTDGHQDLNVYLGQADLNWNVGFANLTVTPAVVETDYAALGYDSGFLKDWNQHSDQYSIEARLSSPDGNPFKWVTGIYSAKEDEHYTVDNLFAALPGGAYYYETDFGPDVATRSSAVYGQATYPLLDWLQAIAGVRVSSDNRSQEITTIDGLRTEGASYDNILQFPTSYSGGNKTWDYANWKAGLNADVSANSTVYATVSTGTHPGGFDSGVALPFKSENLTAYVLGNKNRFLDNSLQVNSEAFYYDYRDYQTAAFAVGPAPAFTTVLKTFNVPVVRIYGLDEQIKYRPTAVDTFTLHGQYLHSRIGDFSTPAVPSKNQPYDNYTGETLDHAPTWSGDVGYDHTFILQGGATVDGYVHSVFSSAYWGDFTHRYLPGNRQQSYTLNDLGFTYTNSDGKWSVQSYVNNFLNSAVLTDALPSPATGVISGFWGQPYPPRTFGAKFDFKF